MTDERLKKSITDERENRAMQDRNATQNRQVTEDDRVEMFRQQFHQSYLPDLPKIPGWHLCWLTTTNPRDSIQTRIRLGYEPLKPEDVPGWEYATLKTGEWTGFIGVNEMLAFKLPMSLYEKFMRYAHHDAPLHEEGKLVAATEQLEQQALAAKSRLIKAEGTEELGKTCEARFELS